MRNADSPNMPLFYVSRIRLSALRSILRHASFRHAIAVSMRSLMAMALGSARRNLPSPQLEKDRITWNFVADALSLHAASVSVLGEDEGRDFARLIIHESGMVFLGLVMPIIDVQFTRGSKDEIEARCRSLLNRFFNADYEIDTADARRLEFRVTRCRFIEMVAAAGKTEIASAFCSADGEYFSSRQPAVSMDRPQTIQSGCERCVFRFEFTQAR